MGLLDNQFAKYNALARGGLATASREDLQDLPHSMLYSLRGKIKRDDPMQNRLASLEHQAFAREWTEENPWLAAPSLALSTPAYTLAKYLGLTNARSAPSLDEIADGYRGIGQGLANRFNKLIR